MSGKRVDGSKAEKDIIASIQARMEVLKPALEEYGWQMKIMDVLEHAIRERDKPRRTNQEAVKKWFAELDPTTVLRRGDVTLALGISDFQAKRVLDKLVEEGKVEKWGRGAWRKAPVKTGEARLRTTTR
jgi:hypothetical protein